VITWPVKIFFHKRWYPFPIDLNWQQFAKSGEGVVIKSKESFIGSKDYAFRRLQTYYVKIPSRVSYEDKVERYQSKDQKNSVYRGCHNIYSDPDLVFNGTGVYEVNVQRSSLSRKRDKEYADPAWYVDSVTMKLDFVKIFSLPLKLMEFAECASQGLGAMTQIKSHRVAYSQIIENRFNQIIVDFPTEIGAMLLYRDKIYSVTHTYEGHSAGIMMV